MKISPAETLVINLKMLITKTEINSAQLSIKSGVSKRMIDYLLNYERKPTVDLAGDIAEAFGLSGWQLIMPSLPYDLAKDGTLDKLIKNFFQCEPVSQDYIFSVAQREAIYKNDAQ